MTAVHVLDAARSFGPEARMGLDAGSVSLKVAVLGRHGVEFTWSQRHQGEPLRALKQLLDHMPQLRQIRRIAVTGHHAKALLEVTQIPARDTIASTLAGVRATMLAKLPGIDSILDLGGNSLTRIRLDSNGAFLGFEANTLCAAGTGSFLDEQALRMGLPPQMCSQPSSVEAPPSIASRCAVFAKSDLIHRQQEGHTRDELWAGLCRSLARTAIATLYKGSLPKPATVVLGGLALNGEVMRWLVPALGLEPVVPDRPEFVTAIGAAHLATVSRPLWDFFEVEAPAVTPVSRRPALNLSKSQFPDFQVEKTWACEETDVRQHRHLQPGQVPVYLGLDIGSTSTKMVLLDAMGAPLLDAYRKTGGDPVAASLTLMRCLKSVQEEQGVTFEFLGVGTTGSGRKLVGAVLGADCVLNEITAHATGALHTDPTVETLFEIGGQDAKYVRLEKGAVVDSNMNYVCAAGTGSFVEELARKLGLRVEEVGDLVEGIAPPYTSDRCTVFMEQDVQTLLRQGHSREEVMGAVLYSVFQNYLRKVVGARPVSRQRVFFQGATARNKGLVAALENLLDVQVVVSPLCHVMGALGVALETRNRMTQGNVRSRFTGLEACFQPVSVHQETCNLCANTCTITHLTSPSGASSASWGYLCGREPGEKSAHTDPGHLLFRQRQAHFLQNSAAPKTLPAGAPEIWMPRALLSFSYAPFFTAFFASLGRKVVWSAPTTQQTVDLGNRWVAAEVCLPVKLAHGHLAQLLAKPGDAPIFVPHLISATESPKTTRAFFCPYNIGLPGMLDAAMELQGWPTNRLLRCAMDFRWSPTQAQENLAETLAPQLGVQPQALRAAWKAAAKAQQRFDEQVLDLGRAYRLARTKTNRPQIVFLGRSYNLYDKGANLDIPAKMASLGFDVLPMDCLPLAQEPLGEEFENMYWNSGRAILEAARIVARTPGMFACYLTNFSCGPDSFIQGQVESIMTGKPMLTLELDEHGGDAGYWTRLEAFAEVVRKQTASVSSYRPRIGGTVSIQKLGDHILWIPPMHEVSPRLAAAVMRHAGVEARALPPETVESFTLGKQHTRGTECVPCPATLGSFLKAMENAEPGKKHALFMPTASGPCRFGQYCSLDRRILDSMGKQHVPLVSWSSTDSYGGLDMATRRRFWVALVLGDLLYKLRCATLPYERKKGSVEQAFAYFANRLETALESGSGLERAVDQMKAEFLALKDPAAPPKPLVGIVGEIYVRQNRFTNQDVVRRIEAAGAEAWLAPLTEWVLYTSYMEKWLARNRPWWTRIGMTVKDRFLVHDEHVWQRRVDPLLNHRQEPEVEQILQSGVRYFPYEFEGESILTVGRAVEFARQGASLVVNCAPFGCMPGSMTGAILQAVQRQTSVAMVSLFYDGEGDINTRMDTFLANLSRGEAAAQSDRSETSSSATV